MVRAMTQTARIAARAVALIVALAAAFGSGAGRAAEQFEPAAANEWTFDCGKDPRDGHRYCLLAYIHTEPSAPGDFVLFGVIRQLGVEAVLLQTPSGFSSGSRVWLRVDDLPAREFAPPKPGRMLQEPQPVDPVAAELAKGRYATLAFQPANGQRRTVRIPLDGLDLLFEQLRQEVP
jgi:hypothetical protein